MRFAVAIVALGLSGLTGVAAWSTPSRPPPTVKCDKVILQVGSGHAGGYRIVLGVVSVPQAYRPQVVATRSRPWTHWSKAGLVIRGGSPPVTVTVPKAWRTRAAIAWGNTGAVSALRIASCPPLGESKVWNAYAGGFLLRSRSACMPLIFSVGKRSATVRFGLARACQ
jgi:hypothetical protein